MKRTEIELWPRNQRHSKRREVARCDVWTVEIDSCSSPRGKPGCASCWRNAGFCRWMCCLGNWMFPAHRTVPGCGWNSRRKVGAAKMCIWTISDAGGRAGQTRSTLPRQISGGSAWMPTRTDDRQHRALRLSTTGPDDSSVQSSQTVSRPSNLPGVRCSSSQFYFNANCHDQRLKSVPVSGGLMFTASRHVRPD